MKIEYIDQSDLLENHENVNVHSSKSIDKIAKSIEEFGFRNPVIIDKNNIVIAGNGRLEAARRLKIDKIPCIRVDDLTDEQLKAFAIADNRVAEESFFDADFLNSTIEELMSAGANINALGFDDREIQEIKSIGIFDDSAEDIEKECKSEYVDKMDLMLFEHNDYIVFRFDNINDFVAAVDFFGIKKVDSSLSDKTRKIGLGRVLHSDRIMELISEAKKNNTK